MYRSVKESFPDADVRITYRAKTKLQRRALDIAKSHVNDVYIMGDFHPKHRARPVILQKKRRNNWILEKFYDAKYIDTRDGSQKTGQQLCNGRTNRDHNTDTENLRSYRGTKLSKGRRAIRTTRYRIQPHDILVYQGQEMEASGCHNKGTRVMTTAKKSLPIRKVRVRRYSGEYYAVAE